MLSVYRAILHTARKFDAQQSHDVTVEARALFRQNANIDVNDTALIHKKLFEATSR